MLHNAGATRSFIDTAVVGLGLAEVLPTIATLALEGERWT
jgi:hypothetical protein